VKTGKINDLNLNRWKEYDDIITDSLWVMNKRDSSGAHNAGYWGNFIPQIPNQLIRRYTKEGDWILDPFAGSGTTFIECKRLNRNAIGIDLNEKALELSQMNLEKDDSQSDSKIHLYKGNCITLDFQEILHSLGLNKIQLAIVHPPYWDIIKFSEENTDLSNSESLEDFVSQMKILAQKIFDVLQSKRYCALIISDKYEKGEWIPLAFYTMQKFMEVGFRLKSTVVKNFEETKGKMNQKELWRYRALVGGFYVFKHEYIFVFEKA
jgi:DNA modification methylase